MSGLLLSTISISGPEEVVNDSRGESPLGLYLLRYEDHNESIQLIKFPVVKETPKGYWIKPYSWSDELKFCLKGNGKRYAYIEEPCALESFVARKRSQLEHIHRAENRVRVALSWLAEHKGYDYVALCRPRERKAYDPWKGLY